MPSDPTVTCHRRLPCLVAMDGEPDVPAVQVDAFFTELGECKASEPGVALDFTIHEGIDRQAGMSVLDRQDPPHHPAYISIHSFHAFSHEHGCALAGESDPLDY